MEVARVLAARNIVGESPAWSAAEGALYWVDIVSKQVHRLKHGLKDNHLDTWDMPEWTCGVTPTARGDLLVALEHDLKRFDTDNHILSDWLTLPEEPTDNRNNELKCDPRGRLWLGTMQNNIAPDGSGTDITASSGALYCILPDKTVTQQLTGIGISNTLAWSADEQAFYFADSLANTLWRFDIDMTSTTLSQQSTFFAPDNLGAPDGSAIDVDGYLWNSRFGAGCVVRLAPDGSIDTRIDLPAKNPTSCAFGGDDLKTLYITSARFGLAESELDDDQGALFAIQVDTPGLAVPAFAI